MAASLALARGFSARPAVPAARGSRGALRVYTRATSEGKNNVVPHPGLFQKFGLATPPAFPPANVARAAPSLSALRPNRNFDALIFDLDGVLYPADNGYMAHVRENATRFISHKFSMEWRDAETARAEAFRLANQTVAGLRLMGYEVDADEFADFCREGEEQYLFPNDEVITALSALSARYGGAALANADYRNVKKEMLSPSRSEGSRLAAAPPPATDPDRPLGKTAATATLGRTKAEKQQKTMVVLTNASERRARIALECLGLTRCFKHVFGAQFLRDAPKPKPEAFRSTLDKIGVTDPSRAVIFEDSLKNAKAAKQLGMKVVFVTGETCDAEGAELGEIDAVADAVIASVSLPELVKAMPELWK